MEHKQNLQNEMLNAINDTSVKNKHNETSTYLYRSLLMILLLIYAGIFFTNPEQPIFPGIINFGIYLILTIWIWKCLPSVRKQKDMEILLDEAAFIDKLFKANQFEKCMDITESNWHFVGRLPAGRLAEQIKQYLTLLYNSLPEKGDDTYPLKVHRKAFCLGRYPETSDWIKLEDQK